MATAPTEAAAPAGPEPVPESVYRTLYTPGQPLDPVLRRQMERHFRCDLSSVRLHLDAAAAESAEAVSAFAYAYGNHVVFGPDQYDPYSLLGRRVLVHELTHVVQQMPALRNRWLWPEELYESVGAQREAEAEHMALRAIGRSTPTLGAGFDMAISAGPLQIARLGANPDCTQGQRETIHQAIFNANAWVNNAVKKMESDPLHPRVVPALRRNFGGTYGVTSNIQLFIDRLKFAKSVMNRMPVGCNSTDQICVDGHCGFANAGAVAATVCTGTLGAGVSASFIARCILHESFHAAFSRFVVDHYKEDADYPGTGTDPLLNADSYSSLAMDLS